MKSVSLVVVVAGLAVSVAAGASNKSALISHTQWVMGTSLTIKLMPPKGANGIEILRRAFELARRWDRRLSNYKLNSELSQLNRRAGKATLAVSGPLLWYLKRSIRACRLSSGVFDITVGALLDFHRRGKGTLSSARARVGCQKVRSRKNKVQLPHGMVLDPGGNGKGVAVDAVVALLRRQGVRVAFVNFGGSSFFGLGAPAGQKGWRILLPAATHDPNAVRPRYLGVVTLKDMALSTSRTHLFLGGRQRRRHIVDPRSGALVSATRFAATVS